MKHSLMGLMILIAAGNTGRAQEKCPSEVRVGTETVFVQQGQGVVVQPGQTVSAKPAQPSASPEETAIRQRIQSYVEAFNKGDAVSVGSHWTKDGVSVDEETGDETVGRDAIVQEFTTFFQENPGARLSGEIDSLRMIRPDIATTEGRVSLFVPGLEPVDSAFSALFVKEGDQWQISSSRERDMPAPATAYDALQDLEMLLGTWQDQSDDAQVDTTVRWSPNRAFFIRSFNAQFPDGEEFQGTQVIGWDAAAKQIRAWTFNSDGSFGEGTVSRNGADWMVKMSHVGSDGSRSAGTQVITPVDENTLSIQAIGETVDGVPQPTADPVTVVRTATADAVSGTPAPTNSGGVQ